MSRTKSFIGLAIDVYRKTPLHPHFGRFLARLLGVFNRVFRRGVFVHDTGPFRIHIDLDQRIDAKIYYSGAWEPDTVRTIEKLLPEDGVAIDIGANIGYLTLVMAARVGPRGRIVAFEPTTWTYGRLRANVELNPMPQIETVQIALSDEERLYSEEDIPYGYRLDGRVMTHREAIRTTTLDDYLAEHPLSRLDFIKCDTDGMEEQVFKGAIDTLKRFGPAIHFELYQGTASDGGPSAERLLHTLEQMGYRFHHEGSLLPFDDCDTVVRELRAMNRCANVVALLPSAGTPTRHDA